MLFWSLQKVYVKIISCMYICIELFLKNDLDLHILCVQKNFNCYLRPFSTMIRLTRVLKSKKFLPQKRFKPHGFTLVQLRISTRILSSPKFSKYEIPNRIPKRYYSLNIFWSNSSSNTVEKAQSVLQNCYFI